MSDTQPAADRNPAVQMDRITKTFGGRKVLCDVSLRVDPGKAFCLLGRSGTGKSVTLKLMIGLIQPESGTVLVHGDAIQHSDRAKLAEIRKGIGFLFQNAALFDSISVAENIAFPLRRHTRKSDREIRDIVHVKLREVELENDDKKKPAQLSGGMSKRAALARALALDPKILLIDEPSSRLDRITAGEIHELLFRLKTNRKVTVVVITHDVSGARRFADQFAVLDQGIIIGCGTEEELAHSDNQLVRELAEAPEA